MIRAPHCTIQCDISADSSANINANGAKVYVERRPSSHVSSSPGRETRMICSVSHSAHVLALKHNNVTINLAYIKHTLVRKLVQMSQWLRNELVMSW